MSTKNTIILTEDNEHWYEDCNDREITVGIDANNISNTELSEDGSVTIHLKPNCHLSRIIIKALSNIGEDEI